MAIKECGVRGGIILSSEEKGNYESNIRNEIDLDQANDRYLLHLWETMGGKLQAIKVIYLFNLFMVHLYETIMRTF